MLLSPVLFFFFCFLGKQIYGSSSLIQLWWFFMVNLYLTQKSWKK